MKIQITLQIEDFQGDQKPQKLFMWKTNTEMPSTQHP